MAGHSRPKDGVASLAYAGHPRLACGDKEDVDARHKAGHDAERVTPMHDIRAIRDNPDAFDRALARRGLGAQSAELLALDERRRAVIHKLELAQARRNAASKEIGAAKKNKDEAAAAKLMAEVTELKTSIPAM